MCEMCCPGFVQKKWEPATAKNNFTCEPCNCFGRSNECVYDEELEKNKQSLDIHGNYEGGGRCLNCRVQYRVLIAFSNSKFPSSTPKESTATSVHSDITDLREFSGTRPCLANVRIPHFSQKQYRPSGCQCDPNKHTDGCAESTGKCECQVRISC